MWIYLDPGTENFPGNEFYIDHIVIGGAPDAEQDSPCNLGGGVPGVFTDYFQESDSMNLRAFSLTNAAGRRTTFGFDTLCQLPRFFACFSKNTSLHPAAAPKSRYSKA